MPIVFRQSDEHHLCSECGRWTITRGRRIDGSKHYLLHDRSIDGTGRCVSWGHESAEDAADEAVHRSQVKAA